MKMTIRLTIIFLLVKTFGYSQLSPTNEDSAKIDSLVVILEKLSQKWSPDSEPWTFIEFKVNKLDMTIKYGQKSIHPFLAEYERKIQFITKNKHTDTLNMTLNTGGRTWIKLYYDPKEDLLILEDTFGQYIYNTETNKYSERLYEFKPYDNKEYLGLINGKEYPLRYESEEK